MMHHAQTVPVPPSQRTELQITRQFDDVILACLQKNPDARPATADALAARLADIEREAWTLDKRLAWWEVHRPATPRVA
jgi:hypothetical protein